MSRVLAGCALAVLGVLASACHKVETGPPPPGQLVGLARTAVDHLPQGTGVMMGLSWAQFQASPIWKAMAPKLLGLEQVKGVLDQVKSSCQIDLVADLDGILLAFPYSFDNSKLVMLFKGHWDEDKVGRCIVAMVKLLGDGADVTFTKENGYSVFVRPDAPDTKMYLAWLGPDTFAFTEGGFDGDTTLLEPLLRGKTPMAGDKKIMSIVDRVDTGDTFWLVAGPGGFPVFEGDGKDVKGVYVNLDLAAKAHGYFGTRFDSGARAKQEARGGQDFLEEQKRNASAKDLLTDSRVFVADNDVVVEARLSETKVAELAERLAKMSDGEWLLVLSSLEKLMGGI